MDWKKTFEEEYGSFKLCEVVNKKDYDRLFTFISAVLAYQKAELIGRIEKEHACAFNDGQKCPCVEQIKNLKQKPDKTGEG